MARDGGYVICVEDAVVYIHVTTGEQCIVGGGMGRAARLRVAALRRIGGASLGVDIEEILKDS